MVISPFVSVTPPVLQLFLLQFLSVLCFKTDHVEKGDSCGQGGTQLTAANGLISFYFRVGSDITLPKACVIVIMKCLKFPS